MEEKPSGEVLENTSPDMNDDPMCGGQTTIVIVQYSAPLLLPWAQGKGDNRWIEN